MVLPVGKTQPIPSKEKLLKSIIDLYGLCRYVVGHELHESGESHYHGYFKFDHQLDLTDHRSFDLHDVHPNIVKTAGPNWINYCRKHGDYISNMDKENPAKLALEASSVKEGIDIIKRMDPGMYLRFG